MKLNFTNTQYKSLIKLLYIGSYATNGVRFEEEKIKEFDEIEQYVFSFFKDFHCENFIEKDGNEYFPTGELDENVQQYITDFEDDCFWEELINRMSRRDFILEYGESVIQKMNFEERIKKEQPFLDKYYDEFDKNGIKNLKI